MSNKLALCIGINDYPGADSDLNGCVNDAHDWSTALSGYGFTCRLLVDADATGKKIRSVLIDLADRAEKG